LLQELETVPEHDRKIISLIHDYEGTELSEVIEEYKDGKYMVYEATNFTELGEYLNDNGLLGFVIPEYLERHIDFKSIGEEWLYGGSFIDLSDEGYYIAY
jgi:hypothetical protein